MSGPFLEYLTVFRSRLGSTNIVLGLTGLSHLPEQTLTRKTRQVLEKKIELKLVDEKNELIFSYLKDKGLAPDDPSPKDHGSDDASRGRYTGFGLFKLEGVWSAMHKRAEHEPAEVLAYLPVFQTDLWMADPKIRSTIGVPTPENSREIIDLTFQLRLLSRGKLTWTSAGYLIHSLRLHQSTIIAELENPFALGIDAVALLRQVIECDGLLLRELLRVLCTRKLHSPSDLVKRDDISAEFVNIVSRAVEASHGHFGVTEIYKATQFKKLIEKTAGKRSRQSRGPGVLEHRVSPRLEWLVDFGYLSKTDLSKNGFTYRVESAATSLLADLDRFVGDAQWAESVAIAQWVSNPFWDDLRSKVCISDPVGVILKAYQLLQKPIGPSPLNDVAFLAAMLLARANAYVDVRNEIISFAQNTEGVTLSGSRTQRGPQNIYIPDKLIHSANH